MKSGNVESPLSSEKTFFFDIRGNQKGRVLYTVLLVKQTFKVVAPRKLLIISIFTIAAITMRATFFFERL